jgi:predicted nucleic acid-binding protein
VSTLRIVVTDSNVLINLIHADSLQVMGRLAGYEFVVLEEVVAEISAPEQAAALTQAIERQYLRREVLSDLTALTLFSDLTRTMGKGEAASLAAAATFGWSIACDEKRVFLREARKRLGEGRILTTPGIFVLAIRAGLLTIEEADAIKAHLETRRFKMNFSSFRSAINKT